MNKSKVNFWTIVVTLLIIYFGANIINGAIDSIKKSFTGRNDNKYVYQNDAFNLITSPENKVLEDTLKEVAKKNSFKINIVYADNLDIVDKVNSGEKYDAIWASNSIWLDMIDTKKVSTGELKSTSITPIVFGIKIEVIFVLQKHQAPISVISLPRKYEGISTILTLLFVSAQPCEVESESNLSPTRSFPAYF